MAVETDSLLELLGTGFTDELLKSKLEVELFGP